jgi:hypothetical protein
MGLTNILRFGFMSAYRLGQNIIMHGLLHCIDRLHFGISEDPQEVGGRNIKRCYNILTDSLNP